MQSRISFFDKTVFRKNLTRFAPAWGLYTVCMFMGLFLMLDDNVDSVYWLGSNMASCVDIMSVITPCYALLVAQLLFGDLFNTRMCNALHALPLRRETWYFTNVASGIVFHLIPTVLMAVVATVIMALTGFPGAWVIGPYWLLGVNLQYLCFFGIAVFSVFCVGNRFAMAVVYGIINFAAIIAAWLISELYVPMFYGIRMDYSGISVFSPFYRMASENFLWVERINYEFYNAAKEARVTPDENWWYYWAYAAAGCILIVAAVQMYRKRRLECAGDFVAIKAIGPVFHVVYAIVVGAVFSFVVGDILGFSSSMVFLFVGIAVGYFTGRMLLERNVMVFQIKQWVKCGALLITVAVTLLVAALDPMGIDDWMPKAENVKSVTIATGHYTYHECERTLTEQADIETVLALHADALERKGVVEYAAVEPVATEVPAEMATDITQEKTEVEVNRCISITISYHLKDGRTVSRYYTYWSSQPEAEVLNGYFSDAECVFGEDLTAEQLLELYPVVRLSPYYGDEMQFSDPEVVLGFYEAVLKDCEAGNMAQSWDLHYGSRTDMVTWVHLTDGMELNVFSDAEHSIQWLKENGYDWEYYYETYFKG